MNIYPDWKSSAKIPGTKNHIIKSPENFTNYVKTPKLEAILNDKTVAVVGPGIHVDSGNGNIIDSCDVVCRVGQYDSNFNTDLYGKKYNILSHSFNSKQVNLARKNIETYKKLNLDYIIFAMVGPDKKFAKYIENTINIPVEYCADSYWYKIFKEVGTTCNSGLLTIILLLEYDIKSLYVSGLDFYNMGKYGNIYSPEYYSLTADVGILAKKNIGNPVRSQQIRGDLHNQEQQIKYFKDLVRREPRIILDKYLKNNL